MVGQPRQCHPASAVRHTAGFSSVSFWWWKARSFSVFMCSCAHVRADMAWIDTNQIDIKHDAMLIGDMRHWFLRFFSHVCNAIDALLSFWTSQWSFWVLLLVTLSPCDFWGAQGPAQCVWIGLPFFPRHLVWGTRQIGFLPGFLAARDCFKMCCFDVCKGLRFASSL